jgi:WD40 repeat protein
MRKIDRNVVTAVRWLAGSQFLQCSEDLTLRLWDIRERPFKPGAEVKVGTNFATNCDISPDGHLLVTGHRGFNSEGAEVKLWDIRALSGEGD